MSSHNTPINSKYAKAVRTMNTKANNIGTDEFATTKTNTMTGTFLMRKLMSSHELRGSHDQKKEASAITPVKAKIENLHMRSQSVTNINNTAYSSQKSNPSMTYTPRQSGLKSNSSVRTPLPIGKRLFSNSANGINDNNSTATKTATRNKKTVDDEAVKLRDNSEISNLSVAVRVRPMNVKECGTPNVSNVVNVDGNELTISNAGVSHHFYYDHVFWSCNENHENYANQEAVFQGTAMSLVDNAYAGYNACLFAYGQTGSGKSYSMMGIENGMYIRVSQLLKLGLSSISHLGHVCRLFLCRQ